MPNHVSCSLMNLIPWLQGMERIFIKIWKREMDTSSDMHKFPFWTPFTIHWVQHWMILVDTFFVFMRLLFFALLLLYET